MNLKNKRILVTGGAGFIGHHLVNYLIKKEAKVSIIDNLSTGLRNNINKKAKFYECDINSKQVKKIFLKEKPEIVYLLACNTNVPKSVKDPIFDTKSLKGNLNIIINAQKNSVEKIIMSSSGFVYGNTNHLPAKEGQKINPDNPYIITKFSIENYLKFFKKAYKQNFIILRYATVYGPKQIKGAMADYIRCIKKDKSAIIYGDGEKTRDYIYIDDVINANLLALNFKNQKISPIFNIGTTKETTLNDLYFKITKILEKNNKPLYLKDRPGEINRFSLSNKKAKKYLRWEPKYNLDDGLKKIIINKKNEKDN